MGPPLGLRESPCHGALGFLSPALLSSCMATGGSRDIPLLPAGLDPSWSAHPPKFRVPEGPRWGKKEEIRQHQAEFDVSSFLS